MEAVQNPKRFKVLFVIGRLEIGGSERQMAMLARHLQSSGSQCSVFSFQQGGKLARDLRNLDIPVYDGGLRRGEQKRSPWKLASSEMKLIRTIRKCRPEIIHAFLPLENFLGALAGRLCHVSQIVTSRRALGTHQDRYLFFRPVDRLTNFLSDIVTVNSEAVWHDTVRRDHIDPSKMALVYNSVDPMPFEAALPYRKKVRESVGIGQHEKVVIAVANLIPYKGHKELLEAAKSIIQHIPETRFLLVGEDRGILRHLQERVIQLGIENRIHFLGQRNDIPRLLAASDLSVLPSHEEGFSNVILESMATGLPVVATDVGGNKEAVVHGITGWLVPPREPGALAEKIMDLLKDTEKARSWGERGRSRVRHLFNVRSMVIHHTKLYERCLGTAQTERRQYAQ